MKLNYSFIASFAVGALATLVGIKTRPPEVNGTIPARLYWEEQINWVGFGQIGRNQGIEFGAIVSNLVAEVEWKGATNSMIMQTVPFGFTNRLVPSIIRQPRLQ